MLTEDWLNFNAPGYKELSQKEKDAIMHFSLLWSLFESQVLNTAASALSIEKKIKTWHKANILNQEYFEEYKNYFINLRLRK